ncbi:hypothetical protein [Streptomyces sp. NPDC053431]
MAVLLPQGRSPVRSPVEVRVVDLDEDDHCTAFELCKNLPVL